MTNQVILLYFVVNMLTLCHHYVLQFYFLRIGLEAHGGYTFCGYAALAILGQEQKADTKKLLVNFIFFGLYQVI